jgi:hypothetical protein
VDRFWTGALAGAAAGALMGATSCYRHDSGHRCIDSRAERNGGALVGAEFFGLLGAGIGSLIPRQTPLYRPASPPSIVVSPLISPQRQGLTVSFFVLVKG